MNETLSTSEAGLNFIKKCEGYSATAYLDPVGVWTIGYGSIGPDVVKGLRITRAEAERRLRYEIADHEMRLKRLVKVPLNQNQFDAIISFMYNFGATKFGKSTLLKLLNRGNYAGAAAQFSRWVHGTDTNTGQTAVLPGLVTRRNAEMMMFMTPVDVAVASVAAVEELPNIPEMNSAGVQPVAPPGNTMDAIQEVVTKTETFRYQILSLSGIGTMIVSMLNQIKENPVAAVAIVVAIGAIGAAIWIKVRDTKESR